MPPSPATPDLSSALPDRPITVRPPQTVGPASAAGLFALLFGLLAGAVWWLGPDLVRDWRIDGEVVRAESARIEEARCRSRLMLFTVCDVTFLTGRAADAPRQTLWYFFIDRVGQEPIALVRPKAGDASDPASITTNLGLDKLYHRLLALALIVGLLAFCIVLSAQVQWQGVIIRRALAGLSGQRLVPVVVTLEGSVLAGRKRRRWTYLYNVSLHNEGGRQERAFVEFARGIEPLLVSQGGKVALALASANGGVPMLLDATLSALDLTEAERQAFFAAGAEALDGTALR